MDELDIKLKTLVKYNMWYKISCYKFLTESFIDYYAEKLHWVEISIFQKLSKEFILKHKDKFSLDYISHDLTYNDIYESNMCNRCKLFNGLYIINCDEYIMDKVLL